jgi:hypothetical protein
MSDAICHTSFYLTKGVKIIKSALIELSIKQVVVTINIHIKNLKNSLIKKQLFAPFSLFKIQAVNYQ